MAFFWREVKAQRESDNVGATCFSAFRNFGLPKFRSHEAIYELPC